MSDTQTWQQQLTHAVSCPIQLLELLKINPAKTDLTLNSDFKLRVPHAFIQRMQLNNPHDPLLLQVLPKQIENQEVNGFTSDPLNEKKANKTPGLLHKYYGRALLITTGSCAVNCRYCFRRHFPYQNNLLSTQQMDRAIQYIKDDSSLYEVILSGGDPLLLKDSRLAVLVDKIKAVKHIRYLRIHTRLPIVIPDRITDELCQQLATSGLHTTVVIHSNHPNEIDDSVRQAIDKLRRQNIHVLNQTVLLKGINDQVETLAELSHQLFSAGVLPYYLHLLDPTRGTGHFNVSDETARQLAIELRARLPGYLVPLLVREIPNEPNKTPIF